MISGRPHHRKLQDAEKRRRRREKEKLHRKIAKLRADYRKLQESLIQESFSERTSAHTDREVRAVNRVLGEFGTRPPVAKPADRPPLVIAQPTPFDFGTGDGKWMVLALLSCLGILILAVICALLLKGGPTQ